MNRPTFVTKCGLHAVAESKRCSARPSERVRVAQDCGFDLERARLGEKGELLGYTPTGGFAIVLFDGFRETRPTLVIPACLEPADEK